MPDEAVIRIVMQGAAGAPGSGAAHESSSSAVDPGKSLTDTHRQADIFAAAFAREMQKSREHAGASKRESGGLSGVVKGVASIPATLVGEYIETVKKTFTKSFIEGLGGVTFGKGLGDSLAKTLTRQFSDKPGEQLGAEAAEAVGGWANKFANIIRKQFDSGPRAPTSGLGFNGPVGGYGSQGRGSGPVGGYGSQGEGAPDIPPPAPTAGLPIPFAEEPVAPPKEQRGVWGPEAAARVKAARERKKAERDAKKREDAINKQMMMEDLQEWQAIEKTEKFEDIIADVHKRRAADRSGREEGPPTLGDLDASDPDLGLPVYAKGGEVKKTGVAYVHAGEKILPVAEGTDLSGPGKLSSDLDVITQALGLGNALREVTESATSTASAFSDLLEALPAGGGGVHAGTPPTVSDIPSALKPDNWQQIDLKETKAGKPYSHKDYMASLPEALPAGEEGIQTSPDKAAGLSPKGMMAGAAAGAGAGALAAAGALAIIPMIVDKIKGTVSATIATVMSIKGIVSSPESDAGAQLGRLGEAAIGVADKFGPLGAQLQYAGEFVKDFAGVMQNLTKTAERYAEYSPQIAVAQAQEEVVQVMGDMRRAQQIGPEMVGFLKAQSDFQQDIEDTKIRILMKLMPAITHLVEMFDKMLPAVEYGADAVIYALSPLNGISKAVGTLLGVQQDANRPQVKDPTDILLNDPRFTQTGMGTGEDPGLVPNL